MLLRPLAHAMNLKRFPIHADSYMRSVLRRRDPIQYCSRLCRNSIYIGSRAGRRNVHRIAVLPGSAKRKLRRNREPRERTLKPILCLPNQMSATCLQPSSKFSLPGIYLINARSLAKPYALDQLLADLTGYHLDIAIVTETHLKKHHLPGLYRTDGFQNLRRDRLARIYGELSSSSDQTLRQKNT